MTLTEMLTKKHIIMAVAAVGFFSLYGYWLAQRDHAMFQRYGLEPVQAVRQ